MKSNSFQTIRTLTIILYILGFVLTLNVCLFSQPDFKLIEEKEGEIKEVFDSLFYRNEIRFLRNDSEKQHLNDSLLGLFREVLNLEGSFDYPFNKLLHCGVLRSPDNRFKLYNWNLRFSDGSYKYYCFIQNYDNKKDIVYTWELYDDSDSILTPERLVLSDKHWYGALYYYILPYNEGKKTHYLLLGWDGNNNFTNKKIVEQLSFTSDGTPRFGKSVFKFEDKTLKRFIIEYSIRVSLTLVYDEKADAIVWDHLAPDNASKADDLYYYGPDASYDGFKCIKGKWMYVPDIYVTNPPPKNNK